MPKMDYIEKSVIAFAAQLLTFKNNIGPYATALGVTPAQITAQAADADYFNYVVTCQATMAGCAQQWTAWRELLRSGGTPPPDGVPQPPVLPTTVAAVGLGVEIRFRALVQQIKTHPGYNPGIGQILGVEGAEITGPNLNTIQPDFDVATRGGEVRINWTWMGFVDFLDAIEIQVDRGDGKGFVFLTIDSTPGYVDTEPFPAAPVKWTYRAIFRVGDKRVGVWSKPVVVTVG